MKKICPYCGRKGELGVSCKGCGYVLTENDKDVPGDQWKSYVENFWEMPVSPKEFKNRRAANISFQFLNLNITTNTFDGHTEPEEDSGWEQAANPRAGRQREDRMRENTAQGREEQLREKTERIHEVMYRSRDPKQHSQADRSDALRTSRTSPQPAKNLRDGAAAPKSGSGGFLPSLFGIVLILYGSYGLTRMFHFFPDGRPLDGIVGTCLMAAVALTGFMCIRPLRLRFWKAARWPIALGYAAAVLIPLALVVFDLAAMI